MNVLLLDQFTQIGGAQRCLLDLAPAIRNRGDRMFAAVPGEGPMVSELRSLGVEVFDLPCGPYRSGRKSVVDTVRFAADVASQTRILRALVDHHSIDLIYVNGPRLWPAAAQLSDSAVAMIFHAHNHIHGRISAAVAGWSIRRSGAAIIACCESVAAPLRRFAKERLAVVPNGTDDCGYRTRDFGVGGWRIGLIGRIAPEKGQLEFVQAARLMALPANSKFVICGAPMFANSRYFDRVRRAADGLSVDFIGWREGVAEVLRSIDLLVLPSQHEGMPRVMLEAFSAGVPVVAFNVGGIGEVIDDEVTGFLAKPTVTGLAGRIGDSLADAEGLRCVASRARRRWEKSHTIEHYRRNIMREVDLALAHSRAESETTARQPCR